MQKRKLIGAIGALSIAVLAVLVLWAAQLLVMPRDKQVNPEAALVGEVLAIEQDYDVLFLGDCEIYESISPPLLYEQYGICSAVCGSPGQTLWQSYALLHEILKAKTPSVVVLGVYGLCHSTPQSEAYNRMALDALPWSYVKAEAVRSSLTEGEWFLSYLFPLLRYHDRWSQLTARDVALLFEQQLNVSYHGYLMQTGIVAGEHPSHDKAPMPSQTAFGEKALASLASIVQLCRDNGIELILFKAPTDSWQYPWHDAYETQTLALAAEYGLPYYNYLEQYDALGLSATTDSYDGGIHLNVWGAEKVSAALGEQLLRGYDLADRRGEPSSAAWKQELARYHQQKGVYEHE